MFCTTCINSNIGSDGGVFQMDYSCIHYLGCDGGTATASSDCPDVFYEDW